MAAPGPRFTIEERRELRARAHASYINGQSMGEIARELSVGINTVSTWVRQEQQRQWDELGHEGQERAIAQYVAEQRRAMRVSMDTATRPGVSPNASAMHISNYMAASTNVAKARGLLTEKASQDVSVHVLIAQLDEAWTRPLPAEAIPALPGDILEGEYSTTDLPEPASVSEDTPHDAPE